MSRPYAIVAIGELLDELEILLGPDHRSRVSRERNDRERTEDGVNGSPLETELAQVRSCQERAMLLEQLRGRRPSDSPGRLLRLARRISAWLRLGVGLLELELLGDNSRHRATVADQAQWPIFTLAALDSLRDQRHPDP